MGTGHTCKLSKASLVPMLIVHLQNTYGALSYEKARRYSPVHCIGCDMKVVSGDPKHVSASYVERQNWTVRTNMRRYVRLSNGFCRSLRNHGASTARNYFAYNFIKIRRTLRTTPAMAGWRHTSPVGRVRPCCPLGVVRAAERAAQG